MVHGIGGNSGNQPIFFNTSAKTGKTNSTNEVKTSQPIDLVKDAPQIGRKDLDNVSPYAGILQISHKPAAGSVESYMAAAPEFGSWHGDFKISNKFKNEAVELLGGYARASEDFAQVSANLEKANFFNDLDKAFGIA